MHYQGDKFKVIAWDPNEADQGCRTKLAHINPEKRTERWKTLVPLQFNCFKKMIPDRSQVRALTLESHPDKAIVIRSDLNEDRRDRIQLRFGDVDDAMEIYVDENKRIFSYEWSAYCLDSGRFNGNENLSLSLVNMANDSQVFMLNNDGSISL